MNLHAIAGPVVAAVNPTQPVIVQVSIGRAVNPDGSQRAQYLPGVTVPAQIQAQTYKDIQQTQGLNLNGTRRSIYLYGKVDGLVRPENKGGDLITLADGSVWLVSMVLEQWNLDWCKCAITLQNQVPTSMDFSNPRNISGQSSGTGAP